MDAPAVPDGLAGMPTGPELGVQLALIDPRYVGDEQLVELINTEWRQLANQQARVWSAMAELARRDPMPSLPDGRRWSAAEIFDSAVEEIRAELVLTRRAAGEELAHACAAAALPRVMQALSAGVIDRARAIKLLDGSWPLTAEQIEVLLDEVLPGAAQLTATGLAEKIQRVGIALDPAWAEHRYRQAVRDRKVIGYLNPDGSAVITGQNLPADQASSACARVDALADAAKRAGAAARIDHLRAEVFLGLLDGRFHGMTEAAIIAELRRLFPKPADQQPTEPAAQPVATGQPAPAAARSALDTAPQQQVIGTARGVHLRVGLGTLLGLDDAPGEIAGLGIVPASVARTITTRQRSSQWRYAILDHDGRLLHEGVTRRRPRTTDADVGGAWRGPGGIVELHVPLTVLTDPDRSARHPAWAALMADLAKQFAEQRPIEQDPAARFAGRPLRRRQQTRFQRCLFRGCRRPATDCDLDHRREHAHGGATDEANLGPDCKHDHELKTSRGWRLVRRDQYTFVWISPLGRKHPVQIEPIAPPLPAPVPRVLPPDFDIPDDRLWDLEPSYQPTDRHGRPLTSDATLDAGTTLTIESDPDPPPY